MTSPGPDGFDAAFEQLFATAERVARRIVGDAATAEDVAAETVARALSRWPRVADRATGWVATVATNLAIDTVRRRRPVPPGLGPPAGPDAADRLALADALRRLPERQRTVVVLRYLFDLSEADTASTLGLSTETVRTHTRRGLAALRARLGTHTEDVPDVVH